MPTVQYSIFFIDVTDCVAIVNGKGDVNMNRKELRNAGDPD
jgi:hypothetical protein